MSLADILNWLYQNRWWYIPLHIATGAISWAWYNFSFYQYFHENFDEYLEGLGHTPECIDQLDSPSLWFWGIVLLALTIIQGPLALVSTIIGGITSPIKLKWGLKFSL